MILSLLKFNFGHEVLIIADKIFNKILCHNAIFKICGKDNVFYSFLQVLSSIFDKNRVFSSNILDKNNFTNKECANANYLIRDNLR